MNRRGFLKSMLAAPLVAFVPGLLWVPPQEIVVPELIPAMAPLTQAIADSNTIYGYFVHESMWGMEVARDKLMYDARSYFPAAAQCVIVAAPGRTAFGRFSWRGTGVPHDNGQQLPLAQAWVNGQDIEPQLWLA